MAGLYDIIIIGSGPAGASAAIYAGRAMLRTLLIDSGETGGQIRITSEIVNYPGIPHTSGAEYSKNLEQQVQSFGVERLSATVERLDLSGDIKKVHTSAGTVEGVGVIVATGAVPRAAGFENEEAYKGRGVSYCATCDGEFFTGSEVFVIGGGFAAAEEAIFLTRYAKHVHMVLRSGDFSCPITIADHVRENPKITVHTNTTLTKIEGRSLPNKAYFKNNLTGEPWIFQPEDKNDTFGVFVFVGYEPRSALYKGVLELDERGYVLGDEDMKTSVDGVYVAGDIRPKKLRQLVTAVSDGAIAATELEKYVQKKKAALDITVKRPVTEEASAPAKKSKIFSDELTAQLMPIIDRFEHPVTMAVIKEENSEFATQLEDFVSELGELSNKLVTTLMSKEQADSAGITASRYPVIALVDYKGKDTGVHYHALPSGHEFNSFVLALYNTAGPGQPMEEGLAAKIKALSTPLTVEVGMSLTCTMCPEVVQGLQQIANQNPGVTVDIIDVFQFPEFKNKYNIMSVPAVVINDSEPVFGKKSLGELVEILATHQ